MNKPIVISIAAVLLAIFYARSGKPTLGLVVKTQTGGSVQGIISQSRDGRDFYEWLGIPYAEPPVGDLRFAVSELWFCSCCRFYSSLVI